MNCSLHKITYPTFRILLLDRLFETIYPKEDVVVAKASSPQRQNNSSYSSKLCAAQIPLRQVRNATSLTEYQSAIALKLASGSLRTALPLAYQVAKNFTQFDAPQTEESTVFQDILREFTVRVTALGYLEFVLSDRGFAIWLQFLIEKPPRIPLISADKLPSDESTFLCQYSHARCVTLIRLAKEAGIELDRSNRTQSKPDLSEPADRDLIFLIISVLDDLYDASMTQSSQTVFKGTIALAQAFQRFYKVCQLVNLSPRRLSLVMVTQRLLRSLLQEGLGICAPDEL
ncbi:DALR anticodon-binding domain-containing protein [Phormidesmis sp. 146-20]